MTTRREGDLQVHGRSLAGSRSGVTFTDEAPPERADPVAPAKRSPAASAKAARRAQPDGSPLRSFQRLLDHLATLTRNTNKVAGTEVSFDQLTEATPTQFTPEAWCTRLTLAA